jgi:hypothetical protein
VGPPRRRRKGGGDDDEKTSSMMSGSAAPGAGKRQARNSSVRMSAVELPPLLNEVLQEKFVQRKRGDLRQGLSLVHVSAQPEPFLTQNTP